MKNEMLFLPSVKNVLGINSVNEFFLTNRNMLLSLINECTEENKTLTTNKLISFFEKLRADYDVQGPQYKNNLLLLLVAIDDCIVYLKGI
jgi:hypothetical protein